MAKNKQPSSLSQLINQCKLNKVRLASKIGMPVGTFKNKLSENQTAYKFTKEETEQLREVLLQMSEDIQDVCGLSFNEALKKIAK